MPAAQYTLGGEGGNSVYDAVGSAYGTITDGGGRRPGYVYDAAGHPAYRVPSQLPGLGVPEEVSGPGFADRGISGNAYSWYQQWLHGSTPENDSLAAANTLAGFGGLGKVFAGNFGQSFSDLYTSDDAPFKKPVMIAGLVLIGLALFLVAVQLIGPLARRFL